MTALSVANFLADFRPRPQSASRGPAAAGASAETLDSLLAAAEARGRDAALGEVQAEMEARLTAERSRAEETLAAERLRWADSESARFAADLGEAFAALRDGLAASVARLLTPVLEQARVRQSVDELVAVLAAITERPDAPVLEISGPEDLLGRLRDRLGTSPAAIRYEVSAGGEVRVRAGDTLVETELLTWGARLAEAGA